MKPFIRWLGSKGRYTKDLVQLLPIKYNTYVEPFVGSGALLLVVQPQKWVINDVNTDLIEVWKVVKDKHKNIIQHIKQFNSKIQALDNQQKKIYFKQITSKIPAMKHGYHRAITFLLMTFCAFMGIIITNGQFKFPGLEGKLYYGRNLYFASQEYFDRLNDISNYLLNTNGVISNFDYKLVLAKAKKNDFVFLDPPYREDHKYQFTYNQNEKHDDRFVYELYKEVKKLDKRGVKWMMTQADTPIVRELFGEYFVGELKVYRIKSKQYKAELIFKNY